MQLLTRQQIQERIERIATEILENNFEASKIFLLGINEKGIATAQMLRAQLEKISSVSLELRQVKVHKPAPHLEPVYIEGSLETLDKQILVMVDDVMNTGQTMHYAMGPLLAILPESIQVAVLVDRKHKSYPIRADYVGLSLSTTLQEHIEVVINDEGAEAFLQ